MAFEKEGRFVQGAIDNIGTFPDVFLGSLRDFVSPVIQQACKQNRKKSYGDADWETADCVKLQIGER